MIGKFVTAALGRKLAGRTSEGKGALIGYFAPAIARRVGGPALLAIAGGYAAKKLWDRRRSRGATAA